jgi:signal peptidase I
LGGGPDNAVRHLPTFSTNPENDTAAGGDTEMQKVRRMFVGLLVAVLGLGAAAAFQLHREGYRAYIIHTGSMTGTYDSGGLVIDRPVSSTGLHVGETITYLHPGVNVSELITHRVVGLKHGTIQTKGDANKIRDTWNTRPDQVRGIVVRYLPDMGYVAYFLQHRTGDLSVVTGLLALILLWDMFFAEGGEALRRLPELDDLPAAFPAEPAVAGDLSASYVQAFSRLRSGSGAIASSSVNKLA